MSITLKVQVTGLDIERGCPGALTCCPVAIAFDLQLEDF